MKKHLIKFMLTATFYFLILSGYAQNRHSSKDIKDSIVLMKWLAKNAVSVVVDDSLTLEKITNAKLPYHDTNYFARINFVRRGNAVHTGCIIVIDSNHISHVFRIEYLRGSVTVLSSSLDSGYSYTKNQLNEIFDTAKSIGSKKCEAMSDQPKMYLTVSGNKNQKAVFYLSCYFQSVNTEFGKFVKKCMLASYNE